MEAPSNSLTRLFQHMGIGDDDEAAGQTEHTESEGYHAIVRSDTCPTNTHDGKPTLLDPGSYPSIVDAILAHADIPTHIALWGVSSAMYQHMTRRICGHIKHVCNGTRPYAYRKIPTLSTSPISAMEKTFNVNSFCRIFDIRDHCCMERAAHTVRFLDHLVALRITNTHDLGGDINRPRPLRTTTGIEGPSATLFDPKNRQPTIFNVPDTVVIRSIGVASDNSPNEWMSSFCVLPFGVPDGPKRVVLNITYSWAHQLFSSGLGFDTLPKSVEHLVLHLKKQGGDRPRYALCRSILDPCECGATHSSGHETVMLLTMDSAIPSLDHEDDHLDVVHHIRCIDGVDIFTRIAELYVSTAARNPSFRLTIDGLDEVDRECEADAAADDEFEEMSKGLPWGHPPPPRSTWEHPPHRAIETTFIGDAAKLMAESLGRKKRSKSKSKSKAKAGKSGAHIEEQVRAHVKILSSVDYVARLSSFEREVEDWWWLDIEVTYGSDW